MGDESRAAPAATVQNVTATAGFAYGVIGADIHCLGDGTPLYVLENWPEAPDVDPEFLRALPSRMLNARFAVVEFTGREAELAALNRWRDEGPRLAARWMHAPGGQGKSRLADQLARQSLVEGWRVVKAIHGPGSVLPPPGSHDLRLDGTAGLLLIVDYADQWPLTHLTWLLSNALVHQPGVRTRVLMLARSADAWPAVRAALANLHADTSGWPLEALPDGGEGAAQGERMEMFIAARDSFAPYYGADAAAVYPPGSLGHPEFGLTLAVHMAALVAVDAHVAGLRPRGDMEGLTLYLLDREHLHWERLYSEGGRASGPGEPTYATPPSVMNQAVFTAAITGPVARPTGLALLQELQARPSAEQTLTDHTICYPQAAPSRETVLEPLYPDRLAEDFLALTLSGHTADYPAQGWAGPAVSRMLAPTADASSPAWTSRAITFLASAAGRWSHLGARHLFPLLRNDPRLAITAGSAALIALASIRDAPPDLLEAVRREFPPHSHNDLDPGIAALAVRLSSHMLGVTDDPAERVQWYEHLAFRQANAGLYPEALAAAEEAVQIWRRLARADPTVHESHLAEALLSLGVPLSRLGRREEALAATEEAVEICRRLARASPAHEPSLARALTHFGAGLSGLGRREDALAVAEEAVEIRWRLFHRDPDDNTDSLAMELHNLANRLAQAGRGEDAVIAAETAVELHGRLSAGHPARFESELARSLTGLSNRLAGVGRSQQALTAAEQAVEIYQRLARSNPNAREPELASALTNLSAGFMEAERWQEGLPATEQAVAILRRLARSNPMAHETDLAGALTNLGAYLSRLGGWEGALAVMAEAVDICRRLAQNSPSAHEPQLAMALHNFSVHLAGAGEEQQALTAAEQAVEICQRLSRANRAHEPDLARALSHLSECLERARRRQEQWTR